MFPDSHQPSFGQHVRVELEHISNGARLAFPGNVSRTLSNHSLQTPVINRQTNPPSNSGSPTSFPTYHQRKIRHIRGLVCRNIALNPPTRERSSTQDDDTLQTSWQSPSKFLVQVDGPHQSLSSSDLKDMMKRPAKVMRRRSTKVYHLGALEDSVCRQKRWEKVVAGKLVDLFFTLHRTAKGFPP